MVRLSSSCVNDEGREICRERGGAFVVRRGRSLGSVQLRLVIFLGTGKRELEVFISKLTLRAFVRRGWALTSLSSLSASGLTSIFGCGGGYNTFSPSLCGAGES